MIQIISLSDRGQLTIPAAIRRQLGYTPGDKALVRVEGDNLLVRPVRTVKDVAKLFASINPRGKNTNPEIALERALKIRAKKRAAGM